MDGPAGQRQGVRRRHGLSRFPRTESGPTALWRRGRRFPAQVPALGLQPRVLDVSGRLEEWMELIRLRWTPQAIRYYLELPNRMISLPLRPHSSPADAVPSTRSWRNSVAMATGSSGPLTWW